MFASHIFALVAFAIAVAAADCGTLTEYCCESAAGPYPRGYVGLDCAVASGRCPSEQPVDICCQQLDSSQTAYYCGQPQDGQQIYLDVLGP
ncbi:hypothetical protein BJ138DRAFT_1160286 [Hygrophoropsis aurantiaca]|uniref:Uncharacterized protein n=1 Tax=Hygrophoropsis aurantiaca TaxID=72124 RepID=A0ACB8A2L9_9AGAM|nr:hypothetical protein BJ138DRAFT_1160286 [Hygrophoropsis aurantiaca]